MEVDIPAFIERLKEGDMPGAVRALKGDNNLPAICGRVCPQETQCEALCVLGKKHEPVAIGRLERYVADWDLAHPAPPPEAAAAQRQKGGRHRLRAGRADLRRRSGPLRPQGDHL